MERRTSPPGQTDADGTNARHSLNPEESIRLVIRTRANAAPSPCQALLERPIPAVTEENLPSRNSVSAVR
jgi:hypothetical protein